MTSPVSDRQQRLRALDTGASFIVQAPAGSGKTSLLTQRYLALLGGVDAPEEIVAITFTRKAAAEMRDRILRALDSAEGPEPQAEHDRLTWQLAKAARARAAAQQWQLADSPNRLRIQTIDGQLRDLARVLKVGPDALEDRLRQMLERSRAMEKEIEELKSKMASASGDELLGQAVELDGLKVLSARMDGIEPKALRDTVVSSPVNPLLTVRIVGAAALPAKLGAR